MGRSAKSAGSVLKFVVGAPKGPLPDFVRPQIATLVDRAPTGDLWLHEIKFDGYRIGARIEAGGIQMLTRKGIDWTARFAPIAPNQGFLSTCKLALCGKRTQTEPCLDIRRELAIAGEHHPLVF
jgi:ATP-dependent DNA ligase